MPLQMYDSLEKYLKFKNAVFVPDYEEEKVDQEVIKNVSKVEIDDHNQLLKILVCSINLIYGIYLLLLGATKITTTRKSFQWYLMAILNILSFMLSIQLSVVGVKVFSYFLTSGIVYILFVK